jgi:hypothetical protein
MSDKGAKTPREKRQAGDPAGLHRCVLDKGTRRMTAAVRNGASAQARNRQETREYQAPVIAASSCRKPRTDWEFDVPQSLLSAKMSAWRIFEPLRNCRRMHIARMANDRQGSQSHGRARHSAGTKPEKSRAPAGPDFALFDAKKHWNHWVFRAMPGVKNLRSERRGRSEPKRKIHRRLWTAGVLARSCFVSMRREMGASQ